MKTKTKERPPCRPTGRSYGSVDTLVRYTMPKSVQRAYKAMKEKDEFSAQARVRRKFPGAFATKTRPRNWVIRNKNGVVLGRGQSENNAWWNTSIVKDCN